jgi:outer membrane protein insertion porin family
LSQFRYFFPAFLSFRGIRVFSHLREASHFGEAHSTLHHLISQPEHVIRVWRPRIVALLWAVVIAISSHHALGQGGGGIGAPDFGPMKDEPARQEATSISVPGLLEDLVVSVDIVGNKRIAKETVLSKIGTKQGRPFDETVFQKDVRSLMTKGMFLDVRPKKERVAGGLAITFQVVERPVFTDIIYYGCHDMSAKKLAKETGLKKGEGVDPFAVEEARKKIEHYYQEHGYNLAKVKIEEGNKLSDTRVRFNIHEGPCQKVWKVQFEGNSVDIDARLATKVKSKPPFLLLFKGYYNEDTLRQDDEELISYYRSLGFFQARVGHRIDWDDNDKWATLTFVINEGVRSKIHSVEVVGNSKFPQHDLVKDLRLQGGQFFNKEKLQADVKSIEDAYGSVGYVYAKVEAEQRLDETPGSLDVVYHIAEGDRYRIGEITVRIEGENPHTRHATVLNRLGFYPGEVADTRKIEMAKRRLKASALFQADPTKGPGPEIVFKKPKEELDDNADEMIARRKGPNFRGQSPDRPIPTELKFPKGTTPEQLDQWLDENQPVIRGQSPSGGLSQPVYGGLGMQNITPEPATRAAYQTPAQPTKTTPTYVTPVQYTQPLPPYGQVPAQQAPPGYGQQQYAAPGYTQPQQGQPQYGMAPPPAADPNGVASPALTPAYNSPYLDPNAGDPNAYAPNLPPPDRVINPEVLLQETQTGRFMLGVGVNSNAGLVGSIVLDEQNFDWRRPPSSWDEIRNGTAWRGAGQRFRLEAAPGTQVQRYMFNFQEPYLWDTPLSFGTSGFYFTRGYRNWAEGRLGGRLSTGYQLTPDMSGNVSFGAQQVNIYNAPVPAPELTRVLGKTALFTPGVSLTHDTRDSTFLATQGHYLNLSGEYNFGDFSFARGNIDARQYFFLKERPDGSGRHVISVIGQFGIAGKDIPIYETYYAGGFSSIRGFAFRGISPETNTVQVGGRLQALGSVEYMFPITADDMLRGVTFFDFGIVERNLHYDPNTFRAAPGFGFRVTVPAMGPAPIALDFAFPIAKNSQDYTQVFSFFVGIGR